MRGLTLREGGGQLGLIDARVVELVVYKNVLS